MTPEAIRTVAELRYKFYCNFAAAMNVPVRITSKAYSSNSPIATWVDEKQRLNYVNVHAYTAPDELIPQRPFILRLAINKSAGNRATLVSRVSGCQGLNRDWDFELTLLPKEILDFLPWIVSLIKSNNPDSLELVQNLPYRLALNATPHIGLGNVAWTENALWLADTPSFSS